MLIIKQFEETTESEIIRRIKEGEADLFEVLIRRNNPFLYKIGMSYGYTHQDVEDLMQETFLAAYLNLEKFKQHSSKAIIQIPLSYRVVFSLRELNGMSTSETAQALDISEANVKVILNRARHMLRNELETIYSPTDIFEFNLIYCDSVVNKVMKAINGVPTQA